MPTDPPLHREHRDHGLRGLFTIPRISLRRFGIPSAPMVRELSGDIKIIDTAVEEADDILEDEAGTVWVLEFERGSGNAARLIRHYAAAVQRHPRQRVELALFWDGARRPPRGRPVRAQRLVFPRFGGQSTSGRRNEAEARDWGGKGTPLPGGVGRESVRGRQNRVTERTASLQRGGSRGAVQTTPQRRRPSCSPPGRPRTALARRPPVSTPALGRNPACGAAWVRRQSLDARTAFALTSADLKVPSCTARARPHGS